MRSKYRSMNIDHALHRRQALRVIGQGIVATAIVGPVAIARAGNLDCTKAGKIDKASELMRKALRYIEQTKFEGKDCVACMQWIPPKKGKTCGGCKLFSGPVNPLGYCLSYAPTK